MEKIILVYGNNEYLVSKRVNDYINSFEVTNYDLLRFDFKETSFANIYEEMITPSLFTDQKIVVISNVTDLIQNNKADIMDFFRYLKTPNDNNLLVLTLISKQMPNDDITKEILKYAYLDEVDNLTSEELVEYANKLFLENGYQIDDEAVKELLERTNGEMYLLDKEVEKLMLYRYDERHVTYKDVTDLVSKNLEDNIYELINSILTRNKPKIMEIYQDLLLKNEDPLSIINRIHSQLKQIIITKELALLNKTQDEIANYLGISSGKAYHLKKNASAIEYSILSSYIKKLATLDYEIKSGQKDKKIGLEFFLLET